MLISNKKIETKTEFLVINNFLNYQKLIFFQIIFVLNFSVSISTKKFEKKLQ